jgi:YebC/PmpR family DNA-binding regulatory protein
MSGHSKWATIKHQKGAKDAKRGKLFAKLIRQVEVAAARGRRRPREQRDAAHHVRQGARLLGAARHDRAGGQAGTGELEGVRYEPAAYEGYAPAGVAVYVEVLTDNRNRTGADIRSTFSKLGGSLAEPGAVAWQFARKGVVVIPRSAGSTSVEEDDLMLVVLDAGAEDLADDGDTWRITCEPQVLPQVKAALDEAKIAYDSAEATMVPSTTVALGTAEDAKKVLRLIDALDDHDDVQGVYANFDIPDEILQTVEA